ncbi:DUF2306 domain-containing protein [Chitinophaga rhizosphaerae]|uniref:DUF2306 domain-containing protein n=1 Tax=Chitinophaga rhizosphaerae TaxID=1864947 RepID=UPI000F7FD156|nr:DUF2306 domain-containing protein [Chitinophaga rhizosphaerae]
MRLILRIAAVVAILYASWLMILLSLPYISFEPYVDFLFTKQLVYKIHHWRWSFYIHVFVSTAVLVAGLFQFSRYLLQRFPKVHRAAGYVYAVTVIALSGPSGLVMGYYANGGIWAKVSFMLLALLWIGFTMAAMYAIFKKDWKKHADMMTRSYALTLSAVSLRFYAYMIDVLDISVSPRAAYIWIAWLSWTLNLLLAEYLIRRRVFTSWRAERISA